MKITTIIFVLLAIFRINTAFGQKCYSEAAWMESFQNRLKLLDNIEGIYRVAIDYKFQYADHSFRSSTNKIIVITKYDGDLSTYLINGEDFYLNFVNQNSSGYECFLNYSYNNTSLRKVIFFNGTKFSTNFDVLNYFVYNDREVKTWLFNEINVDYYIADEKKMFTENTSRLHGSIDYTFEKIFPTREAIENSKNRIASGTGFAISSNGYIVTNHHITNGAKSIKVKGINGHFSRSYDATVVVEDKNNDLSIIKINDPLTIPIENIPYKISDKPSEVGSNVFVLGYPLRATMGDEIKLTNGIISSKSGYQGDITSYQISAPVQPGNSGGPVFDDKGNLIGIISAKHSGAENVSYAIKVQYLANLIDALPVSPKFPLINILTGKPLTEQVKFLKKFTYIIEVN